MVPKRKSFRIYAVLVAFWLAFAVLITAFLVTLDFRNTEDDFKAYADCLYEVVSSQAERSVTEAKTLLPPELSSKDGLRVSLQHTGFSAHNTKGPLFDLESQARNRSEMIFFPTLTYRRKSDNPEQSFILSVERQLGWADVSWTPLVVIFAAGLLTIGTFRTCGGAYRRSEMERLRAENSLFYQANYDSLTGLPNRDLLMDRLSQARSHAERQRTSLAVLFLDLDRFKSMNKTYGHAHGDEILKLAANRLRDCVRENDTVAKVGGDEFVVILDSAAGREDAEVVAGKIRDRFSELFVVAGQPVALGISVGIAVYPEDSKDIDELLQLADSAMSAQKQNRMGASRGT